MGKLNNSFLESKIDTKVSQTLQIQDTDVCHMLFTTINAVGNQGK